MQVLRTELYNPWFANENDWGFEIIDGEFSGIIVQIEDIKFNEESDSGVSLSFHIIKQPEDDREIDIKGELFNSTIELIINDILKEAVAEYEQTGADNTEELNSQ